jgi:ferrochelatase
MTRHVVLLTYGEPPSADFRDQLRYSWRILLGLTRSVADIPAPLLPVIALSRARTRVGQWRAERFESPLEPLSRAQTTELAEALTQAAPDVRWRVHLAYEFRDPLIGDLVKDLPAGEPVDVIPMYVADSAFTHELARGTLARLAAGRAPSAPVRVLPPLSIETQAVLAANHVRRELEMRGVRDVRDHALVLAAHGTLLEPPRPYETGRVATEQLAAKIAARLEGQFAHVELGWLNHVYGGRWTEPPVDLVLRGIHELGIDKVVYFPFGFYADNAETLLEGRVALRTQPQLEAIQLSCLNDSSELMRALARQVVGGLPGAGRNGSARVRGTLSFQPQEVRA